VDEATPMDFVDQDAAAAWLNPNLAADQVALRDTGEAKSERGAGSALRIWQAHLLKPAEARRRAWQSGSGLNQLFGKFKGKSISNFESAFFSLETIKVSTQTNVDSMSI
jgi:hypothetical protein